jgi:uncharacterized protein
MSRDSSGESLEAILASIRRSLAEQATSVLEDEAAAPVDGAADLDAPPIPASLSQHLGITPDAHQPSSKGTSIDPGGAGAAAAEAMPPSADGASAMSPGAGPPTLAVVTAPAVTAVEVPQPTMTWAPGAAPAPAFAPLAPAAVGEAAADRIDAAPVASAGAAPERGQKDALWFLSQEPAPKGATQPAGAAVPPTAILDRAGAPPPPALEAKPARAADPKPSRLGSVRGPLPPFFGSTAAEVVKVDFVPDPPVRKATEAMSPLPPHLPPASYPLDSGRTVDGDALRGIDAPARAADSAGSMRASSIFGPAPGDARTGGAADVAAPQIQALEAMVAELLRPMLRRWLDENMPRLVSAALKAEAELMSRRDPGRDPGRDPKKP